MDAPKRVVTLRRVVTKKGKVYLTTYEEVGPEADAECRMLLEALGLPPTMSIGVDDARALATHGLDNYDSPRFDDEVDQQIRSVWGGAEPPGGLFNAYQYAEGQVEYKYIEDPFPFDEDADSEGNADTQADTETAKIGDVNDTELWVNGDGGRTWGDVTAPGDNIAGANNPWVNGDNGSTGCDMTAPGGSTTGTNNNRAPPGLQVQKAGKRKAIKPRRVKGGLGSRASKCK